MSRSEAEQKLIDMWGKEGVPRDQLVILELLIGAMEVRGDIHTLKDVINFLTVLKDEMKKTHAKLGKADQAIGEVAELRVQNSIDFIIKNS
tara:strand:- start:786 stop:1058 length:273 start_codon:yes stop_codon:yes gene_type:complete